MDRVRDVISLPYARSLSLTGKGITIAYLDTGLSLHKDFLTPSNRLLHFHDFIHQKSIPYADHEHGTHVIGIAASSLLGIAPHSSIIALKVLDAKGNGRYSHMSAAFQWLLSHKEEYQIRIVNISIGMPASSKKSYGEQLLHWVDRLWDAGLVVCIASGNDGPGPSTVTLPGTSHKIITVGSSDDFASPYSGRGPTSQCIVKPDLLAPGTGIRSCYKTDQYIKRSGTSMATPIVSGAIALYLEKHPTSTNKMVKYKLRSSCDDLGLSPNHQGWGRINIKKLLSD